MRSSFSFPVHLAYWETIWWFLHFFSPHRWFSMVWIRLCRPHKAKGWDQRLLHIGSIEWFKWVDTMDSGQVDNQNLFQGDPFYLGCSSVQCCINARVIMDWCVLLCQHMPVALYSANTCGLENQHFIWRWVSVDQPGCCTSTTFTACMACASMHVASECALLFTILTI